MAKESVFNKAKRVQQILRILKKTYPEAKCALNFKNTLELLIATQLSAQCTDKRVNQVTKDLFKKYKTAKDYANASIQTLEKMVKSTGFFRNKARHIKKSCAQIEKLYSGKVPKNFNQLVQLSGVGRKTAHVVMGNGFHISSGVVVDTHVKRLSNRLGFVRTSNVFKIERQLAQMVPQTDWISFSHWLISHGRTICTARRPHCKICVLIRICPRRGVHEN